MKIAKFIKSLMLLLTFVCLLTMTACSPHSKEINKMNKNLEQPACWIAEYKYSFRDVTLRVLDIMKFKNGKFQCVQKFLSNEDDVLFEVKSNGKYEIYYDSDLESFFYNQETREFNIENLNTQEQWFKKFYLEYRVNIHGDAYDSVESDDDETIYGLEVIECTSDRFIFKDLEDGEIYNYTPSRLDLTSDSGNLWIKNYLQSNK